MHVVHVVVSDRFAGVERYVSYVAPRLVCEGVEVTVIGGDPTMMTSSLAKGPRWAPGATIREAAAQLMRQRADVVHAHMTDAEAVATLLPLRGSPPRIATRHFAAPRGSSSLARFMAPVIARRLARQVAISHFVAAHIDEDAVVLHNGVPNACPGAHRQRFVLLAQRLEHEKQTDLAVEAWALSGLGAEGWKLVIAGTGSEDHRLRERAAALDVGRSVDFVGFRSDVHELMDDAALLLAPAPAEPFGLAVVEAMARATPIVAAAGGAHIETVGGAGWLFEPGDAVACAAALVEAAHSPEMRTQHGLRCRSRQQESFSVDRHVAQLLELYASL